MRPTQSIRLVTMNGVFVYVLVVLFGTGSWVTLNGLWVELPLLVPHLPEGWTLPSYLNVIIQVANIGPIGIALLFHFAKEKVNDKCVIYLLLSFGCVAALFLMFFWKTTSLIAGDFHSSGLFILVFVLAIVCCSASVVFLPFMALFKKHYITAFFIGQGMSGLLPSVVALAQGVGSMTCENVTSSDENQNVTDYVLIPVYHTPFFSVEQFIFFLFSTTLVCLISFTLLNTLSCCKREYTSTCRDKGITEDDVYIETEDNQLSQRKPEDDLRAMTPISLAGFLILNLLINVIANGCLPPVQTYSCLPYGTDIYHWSVTLSNIANPMACFVAFVFPVVSQRIIYGVTTAGFATASYILYTASSSPTPAFPDIGPTLVVLTWVFTTTLLTFAKVSIATLFLNEGKDALRMYGIGSQSGSTLGAIIMYILINVIGKFENAEPCPS
ncbi:solute carrier family 52, riboflavin transporter, member 3-B-like [Mizuhopecten yessoensis]|uniref:Riboflavin transporter n=1 Tax=Mizuhopecten yessoensis TaxID=6573 RepID=A0A210QDG8_MIZYE|nr:solute carrier family 52, riboflavin transporter, member 3-B-like [Mizuhopecten yessoensis]OWF46794.1 Riboflavin transporter 2 [Mizuhopecten yessoensis]